MLKNKKYERRKDKPGEGAGQRAVVGPLWRPAREAPGAAAHGLGGGRPLLQLVRRRRAVHRVHHASRGDVRVLAAGARRHPHSVRRAVARHGKHGPDVATGSLAKRHGEGVRARH